MMTIVAVTAAAQDLAHGPNTIMVHGARSPILVLLSGLKLIKVRMVFQIASAYSNRHMTYCMNVDNNGLNSIIMFRMIFLVVKRRAFHIQLNPLFPVHQSRVFFRRVFAEKRGGIFAVHSFDPGNDTF